MSKEKSLDTIIIRDGTISKKHSVPRELVPKIKEIKNLDFVEDVGVARFRITKKDSGINIIGFDENTSTYNVQIVGNKYEQKLFVRVKYLKQIEVKPYHVASIIRTFYFGK